MKQLKFLLSLGMEENRYQRQHAAVAENAARRLGVELQVFYSQNDAMKQIEQLLNAIHARGTARPDGIICAPVGTTLAAVARCAVENGVGWAMLNRECEYLDELRRIASAPVFCVSPDQAEIGRLQGRQITALLPQGGLILYVLGPAGSPITLLRKSFMESTKAANIQVRTVTADWSQESGYKAINAWLELSTSRATPIHLIAAQCDDTAMGARKAFEAITTGADRERWLGLPFVGVDGCPDSGQEWVRRGLLAATVLNPPTAGRAVELMETAIRTQSQPQESTLIASSSFPTLENLKGRPAQSVASRSADRRLG